MLYPEIFRSLESARWSLADDVPWDAFDAGLLSDEQALAIKMNSVPPNRQMPRL